MRLALYFIIAIIGILAYWQITITLYDRWFGWMHENDITQAMQRNQELIKKL